MQPTILLVVMCPHVSALGRFDVKLQVCDHSDTFLFCCFVFGVFFSKKAFFMKVAIYAYWNVVRWKSDGWFTICKLSPLTLTTYNNVYMCLYTRPSMACWPFDIKPLFEPMVAYFYLVHWEFQRKLNQSVTFIFNKWHPKCLQKGVYDISAC